MRCVIKDWRGMRREVELSSALEPAPFYDGGVIEAAQAKAEACAVAIGKLTALLVEKGLVTLDEAKHATGVYTNIELK